MDEECQESEKSVLSNLFLSPRKQYHKWLHKLQVIISEPVHPRLPRILLCALKPKLLDLTVISVLLDLSKDPLILSWWIHNQGGQSSYLLNLLRPVPLSTASVECSPLMACQW
ncbi:unnamed protein product [Hymenolepis diminuta]|uniref:PH domain-containing protein n=1 Tax=Hymenolepis diminuta TaxID=6216 RepID=A0A0R3SWE9_HYMDI|nr:unnamed protein product [Hymenolepis diminuta]